MAASSTARYCSMCGARLASDNRDAACRPCQRAARERSQAPPGVPPQFWDNDRLRDALVAERHMGHAVQWWRKHPYWRKPIPQETAARWLSISQTQLSRIENGRPVYDLDRLAHWARTLRIPPQLLWFALPDDGDDVNRRQFLAAGRGTAVAGVISAAAHPIPPPGAATADKGRIGAAEAFQSEAELFDTMDLSRMVTSSDLGQGTIETLQEAAELLCRAYPSVSASELRIRTKQRLRYVTQLRGGRCTLSQHRELLVTAGWLALLLGCLHYDLGEREQAEAARQAAYHAGLQAGHGEIVAWSFEIAAWFALTEGRYHDVVSYAQAGQAHAGLTNAMVQLVLQQARGQGRLGERKEVHASLDRGARLLEQMPRPEHPENHFVFDHTKWVFYAADCYTWLGDDEPAEEHAREVITYHTQPDGSSSAPMRSAISYTDLAIIRARSNDLDEAVHHGLAAFSYDRKTEASLLSRAADLNHLLVKNHPNERLTKDFRERYIEARKILQRRTECRYPARLCQEAGRATADSARRAYAKSGDAITGMQTAGKVIRETDTDQRPVVLMEMYREVKKCAQGSK